MRTCGGLEMNLNGLLMMRSLLKNMVLEIVFAGFKAMRLLKQISKVKIHGTS